MWPFWLPSRTLPGDPVVYITICDSRRCHRPECLRPPAAQKPYIGCALSGPGSWLPQIGAGSNPDLAYRLDLQAQNDPALVEALFDSIARIAGVETS